MNRYVQLPTYYVTFVRRYFDGPNSTVTTYDEAGLLLVDSFILRLLESEDLYSEQTMALCGMLARALALGTPIEAYEAVHALRGWAGMTKLFRAEIDVHTSSALLSIQAKARL